jgi:hypothetical protein
MATPFAPLRDTGLHPPCPACGGCTEHPDCRTLTLGGCACSLCRDCGQPTPPAQDGRCDECWAAHKADQDEDAP